MNGIVNAIRNAAKAIDNACQSAGDAVRHWYSQDGGDANYNPYKGPVDIPVIVVDENGNAISVGQGEQVKSSPNGD